MLTDDLPWPELGNVSRGATRGNQGQKGVLGNPDSEGRCQLQLRVQPGVLAVKLNRQSSDWYRTLRDEVSRALKLTKTYWRKARRRQDYDARADQDHMELHEWLQQLKDKVMSHLEVLMQKGEIQGPPYIMPDNVELTFLRKFIERQAAGIPHNPRLRRALGQNPRPVGVDPHFSSKLSVGSSPSITLAGVIGFSDNQDGDDDDSGPLLDGNESGASHSLLNEVNLNRRNLASARASFARAQRDTQEAFARYTACMDAETQARQQLSMLEERRDGLMASLAESFRTDYMDCDGSTKHSPLVDGRVERSDSRASTSQSHDEVMNAMPNNHVGMQDNVGWKMQQWSHGDAMAVTEIPRGHHHHDIGSVEQTFSPVRAAQEMQMNAMGQLERKHQRSWEDQMHNQTAFEVSDSRLYPPSSWPLQLGRYAPQ
ncbi:uncharacterized protein BXZ73DRAFT_44821 [Epithele typhae]|uniref:uncharacterized protein n=1 Tax=Epithele typhae TaxID=378194 RepID=UPI002008B5EF|nr:uncharacterized protein BXZ73DRAFT_44821 [Epithele typhae]KAH9937859.1 hypothetical protein BXZ73DRAFT_44821 [Epithele typhae]